MRSFKIFWVWAVMCMACLGFTSCGDDDGGDSVSNISDKKLDEMMIGKKWYFETSKCDVVFYRNHMVVYQGQTSVTGGMLTWDEARYFGKWRAKDGCILTSFVDGEEIGANRKGLMYGTLYFGSVDGGFLRFKKNVGDELSVTLWNNNRYVNDYTDATAHDGALHGTWTMQANVNYVKRIIRLTMNKDGNARFEIPDLGIDLTTTYSTENGHVRFEKFVTEQTGMKSFIYLRDNDVVTLHEESKGVRVYLLEMQ